MPNPFDDRKRWKSDLDATRRHPAREPSDPPPSEPQSPYDLPVRNVPRAHGASISDLSELLTAQQVKAAKRAGWAKTFAVALVAAVGQFYQVHTANAEKDTHSAGEVERSVRLEMKLDAMKDEIRFLSERVTKVEVESHMRRP